MASLSRWAKVCALADCRTVQGPRREAAVLAAAGADSKSSLRGRKHKAGHKNILDSIKAFSETDFTP